MKYNNSIPSHAYNLGHQYSCKRLFSGTSTAAKVLDIAFMEHTVLASAETYAELEDVIWREKLDDYITRDERERLLNRFLKDVWLIKTKETITVCRDPKDNMILELAAPDRRISSSLVIKTCLS